MCEPIHKRYNVALTKVLGMYMDAIVVDSVKTAGQCVQYLKEQYLGAETFLALDYVQSRPIKERLRDIKEPANVKLLYDVLKFQPKEIDPVILFATRNVLVCETSEDACKLAYEMDKKSRYDVSKKNLSRTSLISRSRYYKTSSFSSLFSTSSK